MKDEKDIENFEKILQECASNPLLSFTTSNSLPVEPACVPTIKFAVYAQNTEFFREKYIDFLDMAANLRSQCYSHGRIPRFKVENIAFEMNRRSLFPQSIVTAMSALEIFKRAMV